MFPSLQTLYIHALKNLFIHADLLPPSPRDRRPPGQTSSPLRPRPLGSHHPAEDGPEVPRPGRKLEQEE